MLMIVFLLVLGSFIGWNIPQPHYAKTIQSWVMRKIARK
jgi:hypothetical protein